VLSGAYHVSPAAALAYGIVLQLVEITTALMLGMPALVKEGLSWREVRLRALYAGPVRLAPHEPSGVEPGEAVA
jgi:phosphatidylinositol alpha-mannosyltransferase